jgi:tRNA 2-thiouridine synthesizing protein E
MDSGAPGSREINAADLQQRTRTLGGKEVIVDKDGFLWHPEDWTEGVARDLAAEYGIEKLSDVQWRVVRFIREYYSYNGRAPLNRDLKAGLAMSILELEGIFPGGIRRGARCVAGLPNPKTCSG